MTVTRLSRGVFLPSRWLQSSSSLFLVCAVCCSTWDLHVVASTVRRFWGESYGKGQHKRDVLGNFFQTFPLWNQQPHLGWKEKLFIILLNRHILRNNYLVSTMGCVWSPFLVLTCLLVLWVCGAAQSSAGLQESKTYNTCFQISLYIRMETPPPFTPPSSLCRLHTAVQRIEIIKWPLYKHQCITE